MAPAALTTTGPPTSTFASAFALTTTYTAPTQCAQSIGGLTMLQIDGFRIWLNAPLPVPGTTIMSCYPSEFASSFLLKTSGVSQAAFSPLVCPQGYTTQGPFTSNYIACCPSGWDGFAASPNAPSDRPAFGGTCYTNIFNKPIQVTSYDKSALKASSIFTATGTADQAFAHPYEGFALGVAVLASTFPTVAASNPLASSTATSDSTALLPDPTSATMVTTNTSSLSNTTILAGVIVGSIIAALFMATLIMFALHYRKKRMLPSKARGAKGGDYPDYAAHIRLNNDSPTPMIYLGQPPKVLTDWQKAERRDKGIDVAEVERYEAGEAAEIRLEDTARNTEVQVHRLKGDPDATRKSVHEIDPENAPRKQSVYEIDAAVDSMMEEMVDMMKSKKLPPLPEPKVDKS